uniref:uncharacterized protein n=1 Tax=Semicossyphus pulcher TaxID=241346 RepID=UPI0037E9954F
MRALLGLFMALFVAGDDDPTEAFLGGSILLQCSCEAINSTQAFQWQKEKPNREMVFKYPTSAYDTYTDRVKTFLDEEENKNNCSILLSNITAEDQGTYKCYYYKLNHSSVSMDHLNLKVSASYDVCQKNSSAMEFQCDVKGRFGEAEIQWISDGMLLTNSATTNISHNYTWNAATGQYHFNSRLISKLNITSEPVCVVKANIIPVVIRRNCEPVDPEKHTQHHVWMYSIIPLMLVPGLFLAFLCCWYLQRKGEKTYQFIQKTKDFNVTV